MRMKSAGNPTPPSARLGKQTTPGNGRRTAAYRSRSGIISAHEAVANFSQTCLHDASLAELPPPSSSLPQATAPATNANNTAEILNFRAEAHEVLPLATPLILQPCQNLPRERALSCFSGGPAANAAAAASLCLACQGGPTERPRAWRKASMSAPFSARAASPNTRSRSYQCTTSRALRRHGPRASRYMTESATVCARWSAMRCSTVGGRGGQARSATRAIGAEIALLNASRLARAPRDAASRTCSTSATASASEIGARPRAVQVAPHRPRPFVMVRVSRRSGLGQLDTPAVEQLSVVRERDQHRTVAVLGDSNDGCWQRTGFGHGVRSTGPES